jgi:hypothetical protein
MHSDLLAAVDAWIADSDASSLPAETPGSAVDTGTPIVSAAAFVGSQRAKGLASAKSLKSKAGTPEGLEEFKKDPLNGATSVLNIARTNAGYNPLDLADKDRKKKFDDFLRRVLSAPFFSLQFSQVKHMEHRSKNWDELIDAIASTFEGIAKEDKAAIAKSLGSLAKAAASSESSRQSEDLFVQNVLNAEPNVYDIYIYSSRVEMSLDKEKGSTTKQTNFDLATAKLRMITADWPYVAQKVWDKKWRTVDDWMDDNITPAGKVASNLCLSVLAP